MPDEKMVESVDGVNQNLDAVLERHSQGSSGPKNRGGRPRSDGLAAGSPEALAADAAKGGRPRKPSAPSAPAVEPFTPDTCRVLVNLPFDTASALLGSDAVSLDKDEEEVLATTGSLALNRTFPEASPKGSALTAFGLALLTVVSSKYLMYKGEKAKEKAEAVPQ